MNKKMKKFFRLLKEVGAYNNYIFNVTHSTYHGYKSAKEFFSVAWSDEFINRAFFWAGTKQGRAYWEYLHRQCSNKWSYANFSQDELNLIREKLITLDISKMKID